jgi:hypothetical protein
VLGWAQYPGILDWGKAMSSGIMQAEAVGQAQAAGQAITARPDQLPPMTTETARRLAVALAPHWRAMRVVTAGTPYGACAGPDPAATDPAAADPAAAAQLPPASAATTIFIAGMLERISA